MKQAQIDLMQFETQSKIALEKAHAEGMEEIAQTILRMQEKLNEIAEKRMFIIENGSLSIIKEIEGFYDELGKKIDEDNYVYSQEKLPKLLDLLEKFDRDSPAYGLYMKRIESDMMLQSKMYEKQINSVYDRQMLLIENFIEGKNRILEQTSQITAGMMEKIQQQALSYNASESEQIRKIEKQTVHVIEDQSKG